MCRCHLWKQLAEFSLGIAEVLSMVIASFFTTDVSGFTMFLNTIKLLYQNYENQIALSEWTFESLVLQIFKVATYKNIYEDWVSKLNCKIEFLVLYNAHQNYLHKFLID